MSLMPAACSRKTHMIALNSLPITLPYIVIDQNCLRDVTLVRELQVRARYQSELIILPDIALWEMMKNAQWEETARSSLSPLADYPAGVLLAHGLGDLLRLELADKRPHLDVVYHDATPRIRRLLGDISKGAGSTLEDMRVTVPSAQAELSKQYERHDDNKKRIVDMMKLLKDLLSGHETLRKALRDPMSQREAFRGIMAMPAIPLLIKKNLLEKGFSDEVAAGPSVAHYDGFCIMGLSLLYVAQGMESRAPERATNDLADLDYIAVALFCKGLATKDSRTRDLYEDLSAVLSVHFPASTS